MSASIEGNMEAEGDELTVFLNSCLKQTKYVTEVKKKLDGEGIDYETLYNLSEQDLRETLKYLKVVSYRISLIIHAFRKIDGSGCKEHPSGAAAGVSGFIVVTEKCNNYLVKLQENMETVKQNIAKLKIAINDINKNVNTLTSQIHNYKYSEHQQNIILKKLEAVTNRKLSMIKSELVVANEALQFLEKSDEEFKRLLTDKKLDITKKHDAVRQHIDASQQGLVKYEAYLDKDMPLPTDTKVQYAFEENVPNNTKENNVFAQKSISWKFIGQLVKQFIHAAPNTDIHSPLFLIHGCTFGLECTPNGYSGKVPVGCCGIWCALRALPASVKALENVKLIVCCSEINFEASVTVNNWNVQANNYVSIDFPKYISNTKFKYISSWTFECSIKIGGFIYYNNQQTISINPVSNDSMNNSLVSQQEQMTAAFVLSLLAGYHKLLQNSIINELVNSGFDINDAVQAISMSSVSNLLVKDKDRTLNEMVRYDFDQQRATKMIHKNEHLSSCDVDIAQCSRLKDLSNIMVQYDASQDNCDHIHKEYDLIQIVDIYQHLLSKHDKDTDFQYIYNTLPKCIVENCVMFRRNYRNRGYVQYDELRLYKCDDVCTIQILDKIHCYYKHTYDIGYRLTLKERNYINKECKHDTNEDEPYLLDKTLKPLQAMISKKKMNFPNNSTAKYKYNQLQNMISKNKMHEFFYQNRGNTKANVFQKYSSLKEELINNSIAIITKQQYNNEYAKAVVHFRSYYCRAKYFNVECPFTTKKVNITIQQLLALTVYCNYDMLQYEFSKTYRENAEHHSNFYHFAKHLSDAVNVFGDNSGTVNKFYHGTSEKLSFPAVVRYNHIKIHGPFSTSSVWEVAVNVANTEGLIVEFGPPAISFSMYGESCRQFSTAWISDYANEKEHLFIQNQCGDCGLTINNITDAVSGNSFKMIIQGLTAINCAIQRHIKIEHKMNKIAILITKHQLAKKSLVFKKYSTIEFAETMINTYCQNIKDVEIDFGADIHENNDNPLDLKTDFTDLFYDKHNEKFDIYLLESMFPNMRSLTIKNTNLNCKTLEDIARRLGDKTDSSMLKIISIYPHKTSEYNMETAVETYKQCFKQIQYEMKLQNGGLSFFSPDFDQAAYNTLFETISDSSEYATNPVDPASVSEIKDILEGFEVGSLKQELFSNPNLNDERHINDNVISSMLSSTARNGSSSTGSNTSTSKSVCNAQQTSGSGGGDGWNNKRDRKDNDDRRNDEDKNKKHKGKSKQKKKKKKRKKKKKKDTMSAEEESESEFENTSTVVNESNEYALVKQNQHSNISMSVPNPMLPATLLCIDSSVRQCMNTTMGLIADQQTLDAIQNQSSYSQLSMASAPLIYTNNLPTISFCSNSVTIQSTPSHDINSQEEKQISITPLKLSTKKSKRKNSRNNAKNKSIDHMSNLSKYKPKTTIRIRWNVYVSKEFTENIIPNMIKEQFLNLYDWMDIDTAMQFNTISDNVKVMNYDFHNNTNAEPLYCVIQKHEGSRKTPWEMISQLFTSKEITTTFDIKISQLPTPTRQRWTFIQQFQHGTVIKHSLETIGEIDKLIAITKWHKIPVFAKPNNKRRKTLSIRNAAFTDDLIKCNNYSNIELVPILLFDDNYYRIEHVLIVTVCDNINIGIALDWNENQIKVNGIHIIKEHIERQHGWISREHNEECKCLSDFTSSINHLAIGNPDTDKNKIKDLQKRNQKWKDSFDDLNEENYQLKDQLKYLQMQLDEREQQNKELMLQIKHLQNQNGFESNTVLSTYSSTPISAELTNLTSPSSLSSQLNH